MIFSRQNLENSKSQENYCAALFLEDKKLKENFVGGPSLSSSYEDIEDEILFFEEHYDSSVHHVPPFNMEKISKNYYQLTVLMPGVSMENLQIEQKNKKVIISVKPPLNLTILDKDYKSLHFGIFDILKPNGPFEFDINLPEGIEITRTTLEEGLLKIDFQKRA